jgi:hypothetical protein
MPQAASGQDDPPDGARRTMSDQLLPLLRVK